MRAKKRVPGVLKVRLLRLFPYGGSSIACRCPARVAPRRAPSPEVRCSPESCLRTNCGVVGLPRSRHGLGISPGPARSLFVRRPPRLSMGFHPPASSAPSPECCGLRAALRAWLSLASQPTGRRAPPMGSTSLIATSIGGVHHSAGNPDPAVTFRPRRFPRPRRFAPPPAFAGLFRPAATSRVCPSGDCPSPRSRTGFPRPRHALLPFRASTCDQ
jgi:hypothetical protein